ncbi:MAG: MFS transporter [Saprospiraceae bacterium]|nr:MFS transporter [Saprospiraceae bacterium]MCF8251819.1 MFS transporter [Saprospiraceae bacterium]MCF8281972.1 MFS transporter [Bacteroidales bacterium]MCF8313293.1 MFS transporter [Saprospiraceae bacterium]MCF8441751.1 MFS transporter [Saprospiraceae bacterium]
MFTHLIHFRHHPAVRSTGLLFGFFGLLFGTWAALIPFIKQKFGLDEAQLGLLLLCLPGGITLMNPLSVPILHKLGAVRSAIIALPLAAALFILPFAMPNVWLTGASLFLAGSIFSMVNVSMNTCASQIEQRLDLRIMSTCHGLWSTGAMVGSALASVATGWGLIPLVYVALVFVVETIAVLFLKNGLAGVPDEPHPATEGVKTPSGFIFPNKALWVLVAISLGTNLTEGTLSDWSAVYLREVVGSPEAIAGWGFSAYAFFMASGRFLGDALIGRFGSKPVLQMGGLVAAAGLLLAVFFQNTPTVLVGFAMVGAGVSLGAPILYAAAAKVPGMAKGAGLATMNTFAMIGFLGGPAVIGFVAKAFSLPAAFGLVACSALFWAWRAGKMEEN